MMTDFEIIFVQSSNSKDRCVHNQTELSTLLLIVLYLYVIHMYLIFPQPSSTRTVNLRGYLSVVTWTRLRCACYACMFVCVTRSVSRFLAIWFVLPLQSVGRSRRQRRRCCCCSAAASLSLRRLPSCARSAAAVRAVRCSALLTALLAAVAPFSSCFVCVVSWYLLLLLLYYILFRKLPMRRST